jgi:hypothetical protein
MKDVAIWAIAVFAVLVSFMNPAGLMVGLAIAFVLLGGRYGLPFVGDIVRERQSGIGRAKVEHRARERMRGNDRDGDDR